jgi:hypothetical protein
MSIRQNQFRQGLVAMEREFSRRGFFGLLAKGAVVAAAVDKLGPRLDAAIRMPIPDMAHALKVYSAIGNLTIPVDQDPGWSTFDPAISVYGMNTFVQQIFLANNNIAFSAYLDCLIFMDSVPATLGYNNNFLTMGFPQQNQYLTDILAGNYDTDGWQDILNLAVNASVVSAKTTFYSNYPNHLATPGAEYQTLPPPTVRTGFYQMGLKGPVGPTEEAALRARFTGVQELPGVDTSNPYI